MPTNTYISTIRQLITNGDLQQAIDALRTHLAGDDRLNEALQQSGRFQYIRKQIRLGIVSHEDATLTQNQIRFGLLDLLSEIEQEGKTPLPPKVAQELITEDSPWWTNLHQVLKSKAPVSNNFLSVSHQYGWLIGEFLRKMMTKPDDADKPLHSVGYRSWPRLFKVVCVICVSFKSLNYSS